MRTYFPILLVLCLGCQKIDPSLRAPGTSSHLNADSTSQPNIILIVADDVGYELLTCNGGQSYETPRLDAMANAGVRYANCHATPDCSPSRFMLLTGKYNFRNYKQWGVMDTSNRTIGNMFRDAGYSTCFVGKWQLDGSESSIHALGFDKYSVWQPSQADSAGSRYKSPQIYENGAYLPDSVTLNKYADDWFTDYLQHFRDTVRKPYFIIYSMSLCHGPFSPTPDDTKFAIWTPDKRGDPKYFPSMVKYMDKKVGQIIDSSDENTVVIFAGDNGSPQEITSIWNGDTVVGAKNSLTIFATHVPLILYRKGYPARVDSSLVDFTDFMPTLASISNIPLPINYGILDGTPFYPTSTREWIYCFFEPRPYLDAHATWVHNKVYKRYGSDSLLGAQKNKLYNIAVDPYEQHILGQKKQTPEERAIDSTFKKILKSMHN